MQRSSFPLDPMGIYTHTLAGLASLSGMLHGVVVNVLMCS